MNILGLFRKKRIFQKERPKKKKLMVTVIPGFNCNFRCVMCKNWTVKKPAAKQDWRKAIKSIARYAQEFENVEINIGGGEPYLNKESYDIMSAAKENRFYCSVSSNGFLVNDDALSRSISSGLSGINISLDSMEEVTHDRIRGMDGSYNRAVTAIASVRNTKIDRCITAVMMRQNMKEIPDVVRWAIRNEIVINLQAVVAPFQTPVEPGWQVNYPELWPEDMRLIDDTITELLMLKSERKDIIHNTEKQLELFRRYFHDPYKFIEHKSCPLTALDTLTIDPTGNISLCPLMKPIGNVSSDSISSAIASEAANHIVKKMSGCRLNCHYLMNCYYRDEK